MKKSLLVLLSCLLMFSLTACSSGVSQEEHDTLVRSYSDLQDRYDALQAKYDDLYVKSLETDENFVVEKNMVISFDFGERKGIYTGAINSDGVPNGFGKFQNISDSDNDWIYYGEWSDGHFEGNGITQWDEYSHFGLYKMDFMEGPGMYFYDDGSVFCGEFSKSKPVTSYVPETSDDLLSSNSEDVPSVKITDGELYNSISNIYQDISLTESDDSLYVAINLPHESYEKDTVMFFAFLVSICKNCELEEAYSSIVFTLNVDGKLTAMLTMVDYESPTSFSSMEPFVFIDEYREPVSELYTTVFSSQDIGAKLDNELDSLREKYGIKD